MAIANFEYCYFLWIKNKYNVTFSSTAMLGRQWFYGADNRIINLAGAENITQEDGYSEEMFRSLGAADIHSYDISDYEGATDLADFSVPLMDEHKNRFSFVLDGGFLEHVYNFPTAIRNAMEMPTVGGTLVLMTPSNGWNGHGFYQFSAELFYRLFCKANGYELLDVSYRLCGSDVMPNLGTRFYHIPDPASVGDKTGLNSQFTGLLYVAARRIGKIPEELSIYESDYSDAWENGETSDELKIKTIANYQYNEYFDVALETENYLKPIHENWLQKHLSIRNRKIRVVIYGKGETYRREKEKFLNNDLIDICLIVDIRAGKMKVIDEDGIAYANPSAIVDEPFDIIVVTSKPHYYEIENSLIYTYGLDFRRVISMDAFLYYLLK